MALGLSGSNGGIDADARPICHNELADRDSGTTAVPAEVSYFVNNVCNLCCRHCYVGYNEQRGSLAFADWKAVFGDLIEAGAHTFGNVGKEPLLSWPTARGLLEYFREQRQARPYLRCGLVTNLTLLDDMRAKELATAAPDYVDVSLDGNETIHDLIRGEGTFATTMGNLAKLVELGVGDHVFISFTLNSENVGTLPALAEALCDLGIRRLLISPYVSLDSRDPLLLPESTATDWVKNVLAGQVIDFTRCRDMRLYFKNDFGTTQHVMDLWVRAGIIRLDELQIDRYGVVFCKYEVDGSVMYFNYQVCNDFPSRAIRISHDGYVSSCLDMFYEDYRSRTMGNVKDLPVLQILSQPAVACMASETR
ncbi:MAG: radical SAM protein [Anaerolineales bacterium]|nr:radical SAM protein [Anaerolineales bacterium]